MAMSGLDIYKLLPKTNCRECGFPTCLAFAMQIAKKADILDKCPHLSSEAKASLEASSQPPIKLITAGEGEHAFQVGNETVMFRHEEKFYNPTGVGFIIEDNIDNDKILSQIKKINALSFERVGQTIEVNLVAIKQAGDTKRFMEVVNLVSSNTHLALAIMVKDLDTLKEALGVPFQYLTVSLYL